MYLIASIAAVTFIELFAMLAFRFWELKSGRVVAMEMREESPTLFHHAHKATHSIVRTGTHHGRKMWPFVRMWTLKARSVVGARSGARRMRNLIRGRGEHNGNGGSSLYLKDITDHKQDVRKNIESGKEKVRVD